MSGRRQPGASGSVLTATRRRMGGRSWPARCDCRSGERRVPTCSPIRRCQARRSLIDVDGVSGSGQPDPHFVESDGKGWSIGSSRLWGSTPAYAPCGRLQLRLRLIGSWTRVS